MGATTAARKGGAQPCPDPPRRAPVQQKLALLELDAALALSRLARAWTRKTLGEWQLDGLAEDAETIMGELADNAVHASAGLYNPSSALPSCSTTVNWRSWSLTATLNFPRYRSQAGTPRAGAAC